MPVINTVTGGGGDVVQAYNTASRVVKGDKVILNPSSTYMNTAGSPFPNYQIGIASTGGFVNDSQTEIIASIPTAASGTLGDGFWKYEEGQWALKQTFPESIYECWNYNDKLCALFNRNSPTFKLRELDTDIWVDRSLTEFIPNITTVDSVVVGGNILIVSYNNTASLYKITRTDRDVEITLVKQLYTNQVYRFGTDGELVIAQFGSTFEFWNFSDLDNPPSASFGVVGQGTDNTQIKVTTNRSTNTTYVTSKLNYDIAVFTFDPLTKAYRGKASYSFYENSNNPKLRMIQTDQYVYFGGRQFNLLLNTYEAKPLLLSDTLFYANNSYSTQNPKYVTGLYTDPRPNTRAAYIDNNKGLYASWGPHSTYSGAKVIDGTYVLTKRSPTILAGYMGFNIFVPNMKTRDASGIFYINDTGDVVPYTLIDRERDDYIDFVVHSSFYDDPTGDGWQVSCTEGFWSTVLYKRTGTTFTHVSTNAVHVPNKGGGQLGKSFITHITEEGEIVVFGETGEYYVRCIYNVVNNTWGAWEFSNATGVNNRFSVITPDKANIIAFAEERGISIYDPGSTGLEIVRRQAATDLIRSYLPANEAVKNILTYPNNEVFILADHMLIFKIDAQGNVTVYPDPFPEATSDRSKYGILVSGYYNPEDQMVIANFERTGVLIKKMSSVTQEWVACSFNPSNLGSESIVGKVESVKPDKTLEVSTTLVPKLPEPPVVLKTINIPDISPEITTPTFYTFRCNNRVFISANGSGEAYVGNHFYEYNENDDSVKPININVNGNGGCAYGMLYNKARGKYYLIKTTIPGQLLESTDAKLWTEVSIPLRGPKIQYRGIQCLDNGNMIISPFEAGSYDAEGSYVYLNKMGEDSWTAERVCDGETLLYLASNGSFFVANRIDYDTNPDIPGGTFFHSYDGKTWVKDGYLPYINQGMIQDAFVAGYDRSAKSPVISITHDGYTWNNETVPLPEGSVYRMMNVGYVCKKFIATIYNDDWEPYVTYISQDLGKTFRPVRDNLLVSVSVYSSAFLSDGVHFITATRQGVSGKDKGVIYKYNSSLL